MFTEGAVGAALLVLRVSVAASLVMNGLAHWNPIVSFWIVLSILVLATLVSLGFLSPYCAALVCCIQALLLSLAAGSDRFDRLVSVVDSGVLAGLGPGAYSIDARVFGRRIIKLPRHR